MHERNQHGSTKFYKNCQVQYKWQTPGFQNHSLNTGLKYNLKKYDMLHQCIFYHYNKNVLKSIQQSKRFTQLYVKHHFGRKSVVVTNGYLHYLENYFSSTNQLPGLVKHQTGTAVGSLFMIKLIILLTGVSHVPNLILNKTTVQYVLPHPLLFVYQCIKPCTAIVYKRMLIWGLVHMLCYTRVFYG